MVQQIKRVTAAMKLDKTSRLTDLMYGHGAQYIQSLRGPFAPEQHPSASPIQIGELECGCWVVADGNNRIGLILKRYPGATLADIPPSLLSIPDKGEWDEETMKWWTPEPMTFGQVMRPRERKTKPVLRKGQTVIYGSITREGNGRFTALVINGSGGQSLVVTAKTSADAARKLRVKVKNELGSSVVLELKEMGCMTSHECV